MLSIIIVIAVLTLTALLVLSNDVYLWTKYVIKQGEHYCQFTFSRLMLVTKNDLSFDVIFSKGSDYSITTRDQDDINKLYGLGWGWRGPSYNSYRIGWRWNARNKTVDLFLFVQEQRSRWFDLIGQVEIGEQSTIRMIVESGKLFVYFYKDNNYLKVSQYKFRGKIGWLKYRCFPYFGGNQKAPNDVEILIKQHK